jgi:hypothetical protein
MHDIDQLIEQAQVVMTCPTCGRHYEAEEIRFKGYMEHTYVLQASCTNDHPKVLSTWVTSLMTTLDNDVTPIQDDHVLALYTALQQFDGDFRSLWNKKGNHD